MYHFIHRFDFDRQPLNYAILIRCLFVVISSWKIFLNLPHTTIFIHMYNSCLCVCEPDRFFWFGLISRKIWLQNPNQIKQTHGHTHKRQYFVFLSRFFFWKFGTKSRKKNFHSGFFCYSTHEEHFMITSLMNGYNVHWYHWWWFIHFNFLNHEINQSILNRCLWCNRFIFWFYSFILVPMYHQITYLFSDHASTFFLM